MRQTEGQFCSMLQGLESAHLNEAMKDDMAAGIFPGTDPLTVVQEVIHPLLVYLHHCRMDRSTVVAPPTNLIS